MICFSSCSSSVSQPASSPYGPNPHHDASSDLNRIMLYQKKMDVPLAEGLNFACQMSFLERRKALLSTLCRIHTLGFPAPTLGVDFGYLVPWEQLRKLHDLRDDHMYFVSCRLEQAISDECNIELQGNVCLPASSKSTYLTFTS